MKQKGIAWLYLYLFAGVSEMIMIVEGHQEYRYFSKPLIMLSLAIYFLTTTAVIKNTLLRKSMGAGLIFALAGDVLLLFPSMFLYGLGAFLITLICYTISFKLTQNHQINLRNINFLKTFFFNLPIYIFAAMLYFLVNDHLGQLKVPVVLYIFAMVLMVSIARERFKHTNILSFIQVFVGALLFMVSDSILALDLFFSPIANADILIMGTYILAQLLIVMGIRSHLVHSPTAK
ncbi:lysoplasmalogenase [Echinicola rosea]|nr:lysoplasmalogenase [Echinicola rosea]